MRFVNTGLSFEKINAFYDKMIEYLNYAEYSYFGKRHIPDEEMMKSYRH